MKFLRTSVLSIVLLMAAGCCETADIIRGDYTAADRATYEAVAPKYLDYVADDPKLDADEKQRRERTVKTWRMRLEQAETPVQPAEEGEGE